MSEKFHIGLLKKVCRFERNEPVLLNAGKSLDKRDNYVEFLETDPRGYLKEGSGRRVLDSNEVVFDSRTTLRVRYQDALWTELTSDRNKSFKVTIEGRVFTIDGWQKVKEKNF